MDQLEVVAGETRDLRQLGGRLPVLTHLVAGHVVNLPPSLVPPHLLRLDPQVGWPAVSGLVTT